MRGVGLRHERDGKGLEMSLQRYHDLMNKADTHHHLAFESARNNDKEAHDRHVHESQKHAGEAMRIYQGLSKEQQQQIKQGAMQGSAEGFVKGLGRKPRN